MDAIGGQEVHFPALLPREPYEASGRWTEYGDDIFRLKDRRGADYLLAPTHEELFTLLVKDLYTLVQGLPGDPLPDPDEVPGRGAAPGRAAARARVPDEGRLLVRPDRRRAGRVRTSGTATRTCGSSTGSGWTTRSSRRCPARWAARRRRSSWPLAGRRGHLRRLHRLRLRGQHRGGDHARAAGRRPRRASPPPQVHDTPDTPTIETLVDLPNARRPRRPARLDRRRHAEERACSRPGSRARGGELLVRRRARRPRGRPEAGRGGAGPGRGGAVRGGRLRGQPVPGPGLHRPAGRWPTNGIRYLVDPRVVHRHRLADRRERGRPARDRRGRRPRLHPGRHDRGGRGARRRPLPGRRAAR